MSPERTDSGSAFVPAAERTVGAVLVAGGGIAGIQAALDCANSGFKVYLVERQPAIGGNMARLDKTFPTTDCAMCMISPKLVEAGRHHDIEIITNAELQALAGRAGDFHATVLKHPRFVDEEKCNGCGDCEAACPVSVERAFDGILSRQKAISRLYPQAIPNVYAIDKNGISPCRLGCPTGVNAHGYVALAAEGRYTEALALIREANPFVGSCGMVCAHPCESECSRASLDGAVSICAIKRFVFEHSPDEGGEPSAPTRPERVAVIGAGPAGLSCAYALRTTGYAVTVFEASAFPGGMLRLAIPDFRLPTNVVERDVGFIRRSGVELRLSTAVGSDVSFAALQEEYQAIFVASGAPKGKRVPIPGADEARAGVLLGIEFLKAVKMGREIAVGERVVVIGGGNTALDIARTAGRLGASWVRCVEMQSEEDVGSDPDEVEAARLEGIQVEYGTSVTRVETENGAARGVRCVRLRPAAEPGARAVPVPGSEFAWPVDTVIVAVGQYSDASFVPEDIARTENGTLAVDPETLATSREGVFAGGDVVEGPDILVKAIAAGRRAALSIDRYLSHLPLQPVQLVPEGPKATLEEKRRPKKERLRLYDHQGNPLPGLEERVRAEAARCLNCGICSGCERCVAACKPGAIVHDMKPAARELEIGAVVLAPGYDPFDARRKSEYGFGRFPNVLTGLQFERILSASGPTQGHLRRPSDGRVPSRIAWIQCVGSRDVAAGKDYCSSVCCMAAAKQTILARDHEPEIKAAVFFTDMRAVGKGFERFYDRAREGGTRYVRAQVSSLREDPESHNLRVRYAPAGNGGIVEEEFDMVVLSVGLVARPGTHGLAEITGAGGDQFGFLRGRSFLPSVTDREGVYSCGAAGAPKDIPETVTEASTAAALCSELLHLARGTQVVPKEYPPERSTASEEPRIGVFVCHCGSNIASVIDVKAVAEYARQLPGVAYAESTLYACSQDNQGTIRRTIAEKGLNRLIVASCTPRTHEPLFRETIREAGLNRFLFEMADIREQCSWVHRDDPRAATRKAKALVSGSIGKSRLLQPVAFSKVGVTPVALVIGGGTAGMSAALSLARQGFSVTLVERTAGLGGNLRHIRRSVEGLDWQSFLDSQVAEVMAHPRIRVFLGSEVAETKGFVGNFVTRLKGGEEIRHGVIIVATGAHELAVSDFLHGQDERVITQRELEERLERGQPPKKVVMIQCVGSRSPERPYCSRVCCTEAVKNALRIKELRPDAEVTVLYRDIRTYAFRELRYREARQKGVTFVRFPDDSYPQVAGANGVMSVVVRDALLDEPLELKADLVVLSAAIVPDAKENERLSELLKIPLDADRFFMEAHVKLRPVDCANEGIFICGLAHSPKSTEENIAQALAAAGRAAAILWRDSLEVGGVAAVVDEKLCASCLTCVRECLYGAPFINERGKAAIEAVKCQGCGDCAAACPARAIQLSTFTDAQERSLVGCLLREEDTMEAEVVAGHGG